ncbi:WXG100 family type VII secretion target [Nocardia macrotermitis]|uniref:PPE family domain-containing protein n=1 Tax=Nocardia macrotermitis TaxID=2585198 RepID=A0A7K0DDG0_9NOCA|nr:hypothetical protein [Nocardia macrotermitis]MQY23836.1 hypothetical protein [Nocardia macrotermitis]
MGRRTKNEIADDIRLQESELAHISGFGAAGVDGAYVADREQFNSYTHQQIWDLVHEKLSPDALGQTASHWSDRAQKLHDLFDEYSRVVKRELAEWSGEAAESAQKAISTLLSASEETHSTATTVQRLMDLNSSAAQTVKAAIPPPAAPYQEDSNPAKEAAEGAAQRTAYNTAAAEAEAGVRDTMNFVYNPTMPASGDSVPRFVAPQQQPEVPANPGTPAPAATSKPALQAEQSGPQSTHDAENKNGNSGDGKPKDQTQNVGPQSNSPSDQTHSASASSPSTTAAASNSGLSTSTSPAAATSTPSTMNSTAATGNAPGSNALGVGPMTPSTPDGAKSPSGGGPGIAKPGEPTPATAQSNSSERSPQTQPASQRQASSGMPHAGQGHGRQESDERSKTSPEYLRRRYSELAEFAEAGAGVIGINPDHDQSPAPSVPQTTGTTPAKPEPHIGNGPMGVPKTAVGNASTDVTPQIAVGKGPMDAEPKTVAGKGPVDGEQPIIVGKGPMGDAL